MKGSHGEPAPGAVVQVRVPAQVGRLFDAPGWVEVAGDTVAEVIEALDARYPGLGDRLTEPSPQNEGRVMRRWVQVFVDGRDIYGLRGMETPLAPGSRVFIIPAIAGG